MAAKRAPAFIRMLSGGNQQVRVYWNWNVLVQVAAVKQLEIKALKSTHLSITYILVLIKMSVSMKDVEDPEYNIF